MRVRVLEEFPLSRDGITILRLKKGASEDIPEHLLDGLRKAGFIGDCPPASSAPADQFRDHGTAEAASDPVPVLSGEAEHGSDETEDAGSSLLAKHAGRGKWFLVRGDERVKGPFGSKDEAEAAR